MTEPEFEAGAQIIVAELTQVLRAEAGIERKECFPPQLPTGGYLGESLRSLALGHTRPNLDEIQRHPEILDQRSLQLARESAGEIGESCFQGIGLPQARCLVGRVTGHEIGNQVGLRNRRVEGALKLYFWG